jgi:hypothetical protein
MGKIVLTYDQLELRPALENELSSEVKGPLYVVSFISGPSKAALSYTMLAFAEISLEIRGYRATDKTYSP